MSKASLQLQYIPDWLPWFVERCKGRLKFIKGINVYPNIPGTKTLGRVFVDDNLSNELVMMGKAGVPQWTYLCRGEYEKNEHVYAWHGPNEFIIDSYEKSARWNEFHVEYIEQMSQLGYRSVVGNINTGWPHLRKFGDPPPYPPALRPTIETLVKHDGIFALHEYGPGDMRTGVGAHCLRYRNTVQEWMARGIPVPNLLIGELGIDVPDPSFPLDHHHRGWKEFTDRRGYLDQLRWYAGEIEQDDYVLSAAGFTVCSWDWFTFNFDRELAMGLADIIAWDPPVAKPDLVDLTGKLPLHETKRYKPRPMMKVERTVIHHSVTNVPDTSPEGIYELIENIAERHIAIGGWPGIAYHVIIGPRGDAYLVNPLDVSAYHAGWYNETSVGVCLLGKLHKYDPTPEQLLMARKVCDGLGYNVVPHKRLAQTACPGRWGRWGKAITG